MTETIPAVVTHRPTDRPTAIVNGRVIELEPYLPGVNGGLTPRCQGIANRYGVDPQGGAASQCKRPAMREMRVCDFHGGRAAQRRRLEAMVPKALDALEGIVEDADKDGDKLRAVENVLDRVGLARQSDVRMDVAQVRAEVESRLNELRADKGEPADE